MPSTNFAFLDAHDARLMVLGGLAERYFRTDPSTAIVKLRQLAELLAKLIAAHHALYRDERESFEETLRRLAYERIIPKEAADIFHALRKLGNVAVHEAKGSHSDALTALKLSRQLGIWFHRTYGKQRNFKPVAFIPPPEPVDATAALTEEIAALQSKLAESEDAATRAHRAAEEHARAWESFDERLESEAEERAVWEQLAQESEAERAELVAKLNSLQSAAEEAAPVLKAELVERAEEAATRIDLDEAETRALAAVEQERHFDDDIWQDVIADWLDDESVQRDYVLLGEVARGAPQLETRLTRGPEATRIKNVLRRLGWKQRDSKDGSGNRGYERPPWAEGEKPRKPWRPDGEAEDDSGVFQ